MKSIKLRKKKIYNYWIIYLMMIIIIIVINNLKLNKNKLKIIISSFLKYFFLITDYVKLTFSCQRLYKNGT